MILQGKEGIEMQSEVKKVVAALCLGALVLASAPAAAMVMSVGMPAFTEEETEAVLSEEKVMEICKEVNQKYGVQLRRLEGAGPLEMSEEECRMHAEAFAALAASANAPGDEALLQQALELQTALHEKYPGENAET